MRSPAKINFSLEILGRRPDGYHNISTVFQTLDLADELSFDWNAPKTELVCKAPDVPKDESNLILKAVRALETWSGRPITVRVFLEKRIPMGAGLGGGSSNAACVLREIGRRFGIPGDALNAVGKVLGADVPFFLEGGTAWGSGIGEVLEILPKLPEWPVVVVKPSFSISTAEAYGAVRRYGTGEKTAKLVELLHAKQFDKIFSCVVNDFEEALFPMYPELAAIKKAFTDREPLAAQLSGSGSALFAIARDTAEAQELAAAARSFGQTWVTRTV